MFSFKPQWKLLKKKKHALYATHITLFYIEPFSWLIVMRVSVFRGGTGNDISLTSHQSETRNGERGTENGEQGRGTENEKK